MPGAFLFDVSAAPVISGATLVWSVSDFTGVGDLTAESSVSLGGKTITVGNGSNAQVFGPSGALLQLQGKIKAVPGNVFNGANRTGARLIAPLSTLDPDGTDTDDYLMQVVLNGIPATLSNYEILCVGFVESAASSGYDLIAYLGGDTGRKVGIFDGSANAANMAEDGTTRSLWARMLTREVLGSVELSTSQPATAAGGTVSWRRGTGSSAVAIGGTAPGTVRIKWSTASLMVGAVGDDVGVGETWEFVGIYLWRLARQT